MGSPVSSSVTPVTLAILDHPSNHGHPTYWHARGYGLFAANPLGRQGYDPKQQPTSLTLAPGQSVTFRHRILIRDGQLTIDDLTKEHGSFSAGKHDAPMNPRRCLTALAASVIVVVCSWTLDAQQPPPAGAAARFVSASSASTRLTPACSRSC